MSRADNPSVRLVFYTSDDLFSLGVRAYSMSPICHVAIGLGPAANQLLHARTKGVVLEPRSRFRMRSIGDFLILRDVTPGLAFCLSQVGRPYDMTEISSRPLLSLLRRIMPLAPNANATPGAWSCVRFAMMLDPNALQLTEWRDLDPLTATPSDLYQRCVYGTNFARVS